MPTFIKNLSDQELRDGLKKLGKTAGPITTTTRTIYEKQYADLLQVQASQHDTEEHDGSDTDPFEALPTPPQRRTTIPKKTASAKRSMLHLSLPHVSRTQHRVHHRAMRSSRACSLTTRTPRQ